MNTATAKIMSEPIEQLTVFLRSDFYGILHDAFGMAHHNMRALGFRHRNYYKEV